MVLHDHRTDEGCFDNSRAWGSTRPRVAGDGAAARTQRRCRDDFLKLIHDEIRPRRVNVQHDFDTLTSTIEGSRLEQQLIRRREVPTAFAAIFGIIALSLGALTYFAWKASCYYITLTDTAQIILAQRNASVDLLTRSNRELEHRMWQLGQRDQ
jgi:hypothetical protein